MTYPDDIVKGFGTHGKHQIENIKRRGYYRHSVERKSINWRGGAHEYEKS